MHTAIPFSLSLHSPLPLLSSMQWHGFYAAAALFGGEVDGGGGGVVLLGGGGEAEEDVEGAGAGRGGEHAAEVERTAEERGHHGWGGELREPFDYSVGVALTS
uniref:Uncharacterized protein n=1 Tax=Oryza barthii TaxID=65489 RepID=A0A0D3GEL6_9ORYZ